MNDLLSLFDLQPWKPALTALLLPPMPLLVLILVGARMLVARRRLGWLLILPSVLGIWLSACTGAALILSNATGLQPPALTAERRRALTTEVQAAEAGRSKLAIVVLGGGREVWAPEYGASNLSAESLQRLRYGLWLGRATGAPIAFSGGYGWAQVRGEAEADVAARIARQEHGQSLRWVENQSRDTRDNARRTVPLLHTDGIDHVLLVTHGWHMRRAVRAFEAAAGGRMRIEAAPIGLATDNEISLIDWLPSGNGGNRFREVLREWFALRLGA